jgi:hypothetical protein
MLTSIHGIYRNGKIELPKLPTNLREDTRVIVTFLEPNPIDLRRRGINKAQAAEIRVRLATFADDWDSPEMSIYDNYDTIKHGL